MADEDRKKTKKSRKERERELRQLEPKAGSLIDYNKVSERHLDDSRFERERKAAEENAKPLKKKGEEGTDDPSAAGGAAKAPSATFDAFQRMLTGQQERTIADKINDPNRITWEQYKKDNEDKLDFAGKDLKKMVEYRQQLDREREQALSHGVNRQKKRKVADSSSDDDDNSDSDDQRKKEKKNKKKKKKHKKHKKEKKHKRDKEKRRSDASDDDDDDDDDGEEDDGIGDDGNIGGGGGGERVAKNGSDKVEESKGDKDEGIEENLGGGGSGGSGDGDGDDGGESSSDGEKRKKKKKKKHHKKKDKHKDKKDKDGTKHGAPVRLSNFLGSDDESS